MKPVAYHRLAARDGEGAVRAGGGIIPRARIRDVPCFGPESLRVSANVGVQGNVGGRQRSVGGKRGREQGA
jgi:hypothetical protein